MSGASDIYGGLLLGGRGSRLGGVDKSALRVASGETIAERTLGVMRSRVQVVRAATRRDQSVSLADVEVVHDVVSDAGPVAGLIALLEAPPAPWLWLVACDLPRIDARVLDALAMARAPEIDVVLPVTHEHAHYTCALYHTRVLNEAREHLSAGRLALHELVVALRSRTVGLSSPLDESLVNVNARDDLHWLG